ncbi:MAG: DUF4197 domain-containing protein [Gammaproteobacteria bacterium]|nr:DUF4197 domain-containing protein [Gammaproteobacteria bacterium]
MDTLRKPLVALALAGALIGAATITQADWRSLLDRFLQGETAESVAESALSNSDIVAGLKEALASGVETSVNTLGRTDGFLADELVRIAMPESLQSVAQLARQTGQGQYVDEFETTLNRAAEKAVPEASGILGDAIRAMSVTDAKAILNGPDNAATAYFRKTSEARLAEKFLPIVQQATGQVGVTSAYKSLVGQAGGLLSGFMNTDSLDLDKYVTNQAMDGLFKYIAIQEQQIRENPTARTTDLLKKVFSSTEQ